MPTIHKMIVHQLNLSENAPILSDSIIDLDSIANAEDALNFFKKHIKINRTQSATKKSKFKVGNAYIVKNSAMEIAKNINSESIDETFITESRRIAEHFANSIRGKSSSDGSVIVLLYTYYDKNYLGILKMDPNLGIEIVDNDGNLSIKVHTNILPSIKEKLHKSAFIILKSSYDTISDSQEDATESIQSLDEIAYTTEDDSELSDTNEDKDDEVEDGDEVEEDDESEDEVEEDNLVEDDFDLFILDKQQNKSEVAKFFMNDFLACIEVANNDNLTEIIQKNIIGIFEELIIVENDLIKTIQKRAGFKHAIAQTFSSNREIDLDIDIPNVLASFVPQDLAIDDYLQNVKDEVEKIYPDAVYRFNPNPKKVKSVIYKSDDNNVKIEITGDVSQGDISSVDNDFEYRIDENGNSIFIFKPHLQIQPK